MTTLHHSEEIADDPNQQALEELARAIEWNSGQFALILARCNSASLRSHLSQRLREICSVEIREIVLDKSVKTLYSTIQAELAHEQPQALMVCGLESVNTLDRLLTGANQVREEFRKNFHFPLVWWVTDTVVQKLIRLAPDLHSWFTTVEFEVATEELIHCIQKTAEDVFAKVLDTGAGIFLDHAALNLGTGSTPCSELESARHELESRGVSLDSELEASLEFVLGRAVDNSIEQSRHHLERSLALWRQQERSQEGTVVGLGLEDNLSGKQANLQQKSDPPLSPLKKGGESQNPKSLERIGCVLHSLGLWWRSYAERHRAEYEVACSRAKEYFQQCVGVFDQAQRPDLVAKFINALGEILQRLQQWDELEVVAKKALSLHQTYPHPFRLARVHGFLAEVHLAKSAWIEAKQAAETALSILRKVQSPPSNAISSEQSANLDWVRSYHQGWYLFSLAKAHSSLGHAQEAIAKLETAAAETKPYYDPELYIRILEELRSLYFKQGDYLKAFHVKQDQRSIEQQYGFRAFIGAGRLQPEQRVTNPALPQVEHQETIAQEITASGRQHDVDHLVERIGRHDHKLTVIHGPSGVGKSSLLQAGLLPTLKHKSIDTRDVLPILLQVYTNWIQELDKRLEKALSDLGLRDAGSEYETSKDNQQPDSGKLLIAKILSKLIKNGDSNLLTVLVFDQFEEFFFICRDLKQKRIFYEFLQQCLDIPYLKVILSLREDYLHYLLECNRIYDLDVINNDILSKNILYYLGNFRREDAKAIIKQLTEMRFPLDSSVIDELVKDLAAELEEVRPIELQLAGTQLQTYKISTLEKYRQYGSQEKLVERYLAEVVEDCGTPNKKTAQKILYLLTSENNIRPLKTKIDLKEDLELPKELENEKLDLVLEIFEGSGLVFKVPEMLADRYQLVHDYLVSFIRKKFQTEFLQLEQTRQQLRQTLRQEKEQRQRAEQERKRAEIAEINALNSLSQARLLSGNQLEALVASIKAGKQALETEAPTDIKLQTASRLQQTIEQMQERNRLEGHNSRVFGVSFSPDGQTLASAGEDKTVKLWRIDGTELATCDGHEDWVFSVSFSPNSQMLASASADKTVKLWQCDGTLLRTLTGHKERVFNISFSPDGQQIASASEDGTVNLWSLDGALHRTLKQFGNPIYDLSFSPDGQSIACASDDKTIKLWTLDSTWPKIFNGHQAGVLSVSFSPDGQLLASASKDGTVKLWSLDGREIETLQKHNFWIYRVSFSPDGQMLVLTSADGIVRLCSLDGSVVTTFRGHIGEVFGLCFSPDSQLLVSAGQDKTVRLWSLDGIGLNTQKGHSDRVIGFSFSPVDQLLASASEDKTVKLWKIDDKLLKTLLRTFQGHNTSLRSVSFSPDGQLLASASVDGIVKLWRLDGTLLKTFQGHTLSVRSLSFSRDGQLLASGSNDRTVKFWRLDGSLFQTLYGHTAEILSIRFSPNGQILASAGEDKTIKLWSINGTLLQTLKGHSKKIFCVRFSPDSQLLASTSADRTVKLWSYDGTLLNTLSGHEAGVRGVIFSPDSQTIASFSNDKTVKLWSRHGNLLRTLKGHLNSVYNASFSADGKKVFSIDENINVKLWSINGTELQSLQHFYPSQGNGNTTLELKRLVIQGCNWISDYLNSNPHLSESDRQLWEGISTQK